MNAGPLTIAGLTGLHLSAVGSELIEVQAGLWLLVAAGVVAIWLMSQSLANTAGRIALMGLLLTIGLAPVENAGLGGALVLITAYARKVICLPK